MSPCSRAEIRSWLQMGFIEPRLFPGLRIYGFLLPKRLFFQCGRRLFFLVVLYLFTLKMFLLEAVTD